jgi:D-alanyl-D-alanine carboxypeptidase
MSFLARAGANTTAAVGGVVAGLLLGLATQGATMPVRPDPGAEAGVNAPGPATGQPSGPSALLAWSVGGMPAGSERAIAEAPGVIEATSVYAGLDWMRSATASDGTQLDNPDGKMAVPIEVAVIKPREYALTLPPSERDPILALRPGQALLADTEADLRRGGEGLEMDLAERTVRVTGVISDQATNGYEMLLSAPVPPEWARADRFILAIVRHCRRATVKRRLSEVMPAGSTLRLRCGREQPFLRYGDSVLPQMIIKERFGEFAARPLADGTIAVDPKWEAASIRTARVPLLGRITCHRAVFPQLRQAMRDLMSKSLGPLVDPAQYEGCYVPRFIDRDPDGRLSHHSWGIALDINHDENLFGAAPNQDEQLVEVMAEWGFTWGGRWLVPDGMHFEWLRWP